MIIIEEMKQLLDPNLREFLEEREVCDQYCVSIRNEFYNNNRQLDRLSLNIEDIYKWSRFQYSTYTLSDCITKAFNWGGSPHGEINWNALHLEYGQYVQRLPSSVRLSSSNKVPLSTVKKNNINIPDIEKSIFTEKDKNNINKLIKTVTDDTFTNSINKLNYLLKVFSDINPSVIDIKNKKQLKTYLLDLHFKVIQTHHGYTN